ncbi:hypothetical protein JNB63_06265 [Microbacterium trichothecenolyticum]|uniref:Uncharacterized protein n=1 Tax=Microbacterium ureisolvens TaxID=2781186 RepID=A0ABS7HYS0_9MICO|nr:MULTISPECIES: hypothetical protein [Microbacterium]MBW9110542.1 hypothetical protein [Microbacterium ureisolvens]MBW9119692.1 hypothetical protein [Microbacterium trichothecenolyticum]
MIDEALSSAVITYVGYDTDTAIPGRHPDRIADEGLRREVLAIVATVDREEPGDQGLWVWGSEVAKRVGEQYPQLSSEALDALKALITFEWR